MPQLTKYSVHTHTHIYIGVYMYTHYANKQACRSEEQTMLMLT